MSRAVTVAALMLCLVPVGADAQSVCAMTEQQANQSPQCVRWYFNCKYDPTGKPPANSAFANVPLGTLKRLQVYAVFRLAQTGCDVFSYQEALAAMQAHTFGFSDAPFK